MASNWNEKEPNNRVRDGSEENCLMALANGKWNDDLCDRKLKAACQDSKLLFLWSMFFWLDFFVK